MFVGCIYRAGDQNLVEFITKMDEGFLNCNLERWELILLVRVTGNSKTTKDLIVVNNNHLIILSEVIFLYLSDHNWILYVFRAGVRKLPAKGIESRSFKNHVKGAFIRDLSAESNI